MQQQLKKQLQNAEQQLSQHYQTNHHRRKSSRMFEELARNNQHLNSVQQSIQQLFTPEKVEQYHDINSEVGFEFRLSQDEIFQTSRSNNDEEPTIHINNKLCSDNNKNQILDQKYLEAMEEDQPRQLSQQLQQHPTTTMHSSLSFINKNHQKSKSIVSQDFKELMYKALDHPFKGKEVLQETLQNVQYETVNARQQLQNDILKMNQYDQRSSQQASAQFFYPDTSTKLSPMKSANPSKAETRYLNQASPSFASVSSRNINQSYHQNDENFYPIETFRTTQRSTYEDNTQQSQTQNHNQSQKSFRSSKSQQKQQNIIHSRQSVITYATNSTHYQTQLKQNQLNQTQILSQSLYNSNSTIKHTQQSQKGAMASVIIQKIESKTQKVTTEISENVKQYKEQENVKRELQRYIDNMRNELQKIKKDQIKLKENIPQYADYTSQLCFKISHKRSKSQDIVKDLNILRNQVKQLEYDNEQLKQKRLQIKQNLKIEGIRAKNITKNVQEMKLKLVQVQREKEKYITEISKQIKIIKNQQQRLQTMSDNSSKIYDNFEFTTSKILTDKPIKKGIFKH